MSVIIDFFSHPFFIVVGGLSSFIVIFCGLYGALAVMKGTLRIWIRLGNNLVNRKIAVFADERYYELESLLIDSDIFKRCNIIRINQGDLKKAEDITLKLVHWKSFAARIDEILSMKKHADALIVYAPSEEGRLQNDEMNKLNSHGNTALVTFKGRLLNDITMFMITTAYKRNKG